MKVIVCGAGKVGANIARYLASESNDVTIVDHSPELIRKISESLDVQAIEGMASYPGILERAGAADADMIIAMTRSDEVNMMACQVAHSLFKIPTKIARIRQQDYLDPLWADLFTRENMPIDVIISPEIEVARAIARRLKVPGAFDMIPLADGLVSVIGVICTETCPLLNTPLKLLPTLFPDLNLEVPALVRKGKALVPSPEEQLLVGDEVYFVIETALAVRALAAFGHEEPEAHRVLIIGGGNIGYYLAAELERDAPQVSVRIIERNVKRAEIIAHQLEKTVILCGDGLDRDILEEANVRSTDTVVTVSNDDEGNILASLLAKSCGVPRAITLINNSAYSSLVTPLGIDAVVDPRAITVSTILQHIRRGRIRSVHSLREGFAEIIEADALETSQLINIPIKQIDLPARVRIGAVVRSGRVLMPRPNTVIKAGDRVIILAAQDQIRQIERMFAVRLEYF